jgi:hypothetical protein
MKDEEKMQKDEHDMMLMRIIKFSIHELKVLKAWTG